MAAYIKTYNPRSYAGARANASRLLRHPHVNAAMQWVKTRSKGITDIVYQADDDEAYAFAIAIEQALLSAVWTVSGLLKRSASAEPSNGSNRPLSRNGPNFPGCARFRIGPLPCFLLREAGLVASSVIVLTQGRLAGKPFEADSPLDAIMAAFEAAQITCVTNSPT